MGKLKDIDEAIAEKRGHIMRLNNEVQLLERARALLNGGGTPSVARPKEAATKPLVRRVGGKPRFHRVRRVSRPHPKRGAVSPTSDVGLAIAAYREAGVPLHVNVLLPRMEKAKGSAVNKASLIGSLARLTKNGLHFYRSAPNTFGLLEWKRTQSLEGGRKTKLKVMA